MFLDDSFLHPMTVDIHGKSCVAPSLAHAFWAGRVQDVGPSVNRVLAAKDAASAKRQANASLPVVGWNQVKEEWRGKLLRVKFADPKLREWLIRSPLALLRAKGLDWLQAELQPTVPAVAALVPPVQPSVPSASTPQVSNAGSGGTWITYPGGTPVLLAPKVRVRDETTLLGKGGTETVSEARARLLSNFSLKKKVEQDCPCCGKRGTADARGITRHDGKCLITLCKAFADKLGTTLPTLADNIDTLWPANGGPWLRTNEAGGAAMAKYGVNVHGGGRVWSQLRYRGLLEEGEKDKSETTYQGSARWRPMKLGVLFAAGRVSIPNKVTTFDNALALGPWMNGAAEPWNMVTIRDLKGFDFDAFMRGED
jgi:hypothetical protein